MHVETGMIAYPVQSHHKSMYGTKFKVLEPVSPGKWKLLCIEGTSKQMSKEPATWSEQNFTISGESVEEDPQYASIPAPGTEVMYLYDGEPEKVTVVGVGYHRSAPGHWLALIDMDDQTVGVHPQFLAAL